MYLRDALQEMENDILEYQDKIQSRLETLFDFLKRIYTDFSGEDVSDVEYNEGKLIEYLKYVLKRGVRPEKIFYILDHDVADTESQFVLDGFFEKFSGPPLSR